MTRRELAEKLGVESQSVARWELGIRPVSPEAELFFARSDIAKLRRQRDELKHRLADAEAAFLQAAEPHVEQRLDPVRAKTLHDRIDESYTALVASRDGGVVTLAKQMYEAWKELVELYAGAPRDQDAPWRWTGQGEVQPVERRGSGPV